MCSTKALRNALLKSYTTSQDFLSRFLTSFCFALEIGIPPSLLNTPIPKPKLGNHLVGTLNAFSTETRSEYLFWAVAGPDSWRGACTTPEDGRRNQLVLVFGGPDGEVQLDTDRISLVPIAITTETAKSTCNVLLKVIHAQPSKTTFVSMESKGI